MSVKPEDDGILHPEDDGFYHPKDEAELIELIHLAREKHYELRVKGSGHSVPHAIYVDGFDYRAAEQYAPSGVSNNYKANFQKVHIPEGTIPVLLDHFDKVTWNKIGDTWYATAQAGVHLGKDPYDPTEKSTYFNSLFYQMEQKGVSVGDMGGITHQTVGGFLATGSAGGSTIHSLEPFLHEFTFIDGNGEKHTCSKELNKDMFEAVGVSMGLLGVVTEVVFKTQPRFDIQGTEEIRPIEDYKGYIEPFNDNDSPTSLYSFFTSKKAEYSRILWWPQKNVNKMTVWSAQKMKYPDDYNASNSKEVDGKRVLVPQPYQEVKWSFGSSFFQEYLGDFFYTGVAYWPTWLWKKLKNSWLSMFIQQVIEVFWDGRILKFLLDIFVPTDTKKDGEFVPQYFWDTWWRGLPMDNQMDDRLIGVVFTEIWMPMDKMDEIMRVLQKMYKEKGLHATGTFSAELYCTTGCDFWMSPAYKRDVFRVDLFLSATDLFNPKDYYEQFWELLKPYHMRTHWGKWQPGATDHQEKRVEWREYLKEQYPKWDDFLAMRDQLDPDQIFVNEYWRERFDIPRIHPKPTAPALEWDGDEPIDFDPETKTTPETEDLPPPNSALLLGRKKPAPLPVLGYVLSIIYTIIIAAIPIWIMGNTMTGVCISKSMEVQMWLAVFLGSLVGFGVAWLRYFGPIAMIILTFVGMIVANLVDYGTGWMFWTWTSVGGASPFWTALVCETLSALFVPTVSWIIGSKLLSKYWPK